MSKVRDSIFTESVDWGKDITQEECLELLEKNSMVTLVPNRKAPQWVQWVKEHDHQYTEYRFNSDGDLAIYRVEDPKELLDNLTEPTVVLMPDEAFEDLLEDDTPKYEAFKGMTGNRFVLAGKGKLDGKEVSPLVWRDEEGWNIEYGDGSEIKSGNFTDVMDDLEKRFVGVFEEKEILTFGKPVKDSVVYNDGKKLYVVEGFEKSKAGTVATLLVKDSLESGPFDRKIVVDSEFFHRLGVGFPIYGIDSIKKSLSRVLKDSVSLTITEKDGNVLIGDNEVFRNESLSSIKKMDFAISRMLLMRNVKGARVKDSVVKAFVSSKGKSLFKHMRITDSEELKKGYTPEEIAEKHNLDVQEVLDQFKVGEEIEKEHTDSVEVANVIASHHLWEFPDYYTRLVELEKQAKSALDSYETEEVELEAGVFVVTPEGQGQIIEEKNGVYVVEYQDGEIDVYEKEDLVVVKA